MPVITMPLSSGTPGFVRDQFAERPPRFGDAEDIEARKLLELAAIAKRACAIQGFCTCRYGCYDSTHWGRKLHPYEIDCMRKDQLVEVINRLVELGEVERGELVGLGVN